MTSQSRDFVDMFVIEALSFLSSKRSFKGNGYTVHNTSMKCSSLYSRVGFIVLFFLLKLFKGSL